jgi:hypothetical protein
MTDAHIEQTPRRWRAVLILLAIAAAWMLIAYLAPPLGIVAVFIHIICAFLDIGMNGARDAEFSTANFIGAALAWIGAMLGMPS